MFSQFNFTLESTSVDLDEILGTPEEVVQNKATEAGEGVIIEDTSLDIEGANVGVEIRWVMDHMDEFAGRKALWRVLLGVRKGEHVHIYEGLIEGTIVPARGNSNFGFDPVFQPAGSDKTLAEEKPDSNSARYAAIKALCEGNSKAVLPILPSSAWTGEWQSAH
eukprot:TRINITY_DN5638_c0_g1_i1.p1 TRINITY_DN5638_c0_g1~~TRINITY_DN5638_c0_g1_i1.p1  ORF type:complete len:188 (+),score=39.21 TRINITY_DN5638_c0_g1_i1:74-565(+)